MQYIHPKSICVRRIMVNSEHYHSSGFVNRVCIAIFSSLVRIHSTLRCRHFFFALSKPFICSSLFERNHWMFSNALQSTTTIRSTRTWIGRNINGPTTINVHKTMVALWNLYSHTHTHSTRILTYSYQRNKTKENKWNCRGQRSGLKHESWLA